jgi:hypothetical protein
MERACTAMKPDRLIAFRSVEDQAPYHLDARRRELVLRAMVELFRTEAGYCSPLMSGPTTRTPL